MCADGFQQLENMLRLIVDVSGGIGIWLIAFCCVLKQFLRVWRRRDGDEDEAQKNDEIHYKRIMVRPSGT